MDASLEFGVRDPSIEYRERIGAYGVAHRNGAILIERTPLGLFLPGGGIEVGETPEEALRREFMEETGFEIADPSKIGVATEYVPHQGDLGYFLKKVGHFYVVELGQAGEPTHSDGDNHRIEWIEVSILRDRMFHKFYWWAIERALSFA